MLFICGLVNMMHCVTQIICGATHTLCHGQHNWLCGMVVWVNLGQLVYYFDPPHIEKNKLFLYEYQSNYDYVKL